MRLHSKSRQFTCCTLFAIMLNTLRKWLRRVCVYLAVKILKKSKKCEGETRSNYYFIRNWIRLNSSTFDGLQGLVTFKRFSFFASFPFFFFILQNIKGPLGLMCFSFGITLIDVFNADFRKNLFLPSNLLFRAILFFPRRSAENESIYRHTNWFQVWQ